MYLLNYQLEPKCLTSNAVPSILLLVNVQLNIQLSQGSAAKSFHFHSYMYVCRLFKN